MLNAVLAAPFTAPRPASHLPYAIAGLVQGPSRLTAHHGRVEQSEMERTFNMGVGMVAVVGADDADVVESQLRDAGETVYRIGQLTARTGEGCVLKGLESW